MTDTDVQPNLYDFIGQGSFSYKTFLRAAERTFAAFDGTAFGIGENKALYDLLMYSRRYGHRPHWDPDKARAALDELTSPQSVFSQQLENTPEVFVEGLVGYINANESNPFRKIVYLHGLRSELPRLGLHQDSYITRALVPVEREIYNALNEARQCAKQNQYGPKVKDIQELLDASINIQDPRDSFWTGVNLTLSYNNFSFASAVNEWFVKHHLGGKDASKQKPFPDREECWAKIAGSPREHPPKVLGQYRPQMFFNQAADKMAVIAVMAQASAVEPAGKKLLVNVPEVVGSGHRWKKFPVGFSPKTRAFPPLVRSL
jgi:hypothetical protein